MIQNRQKDEHNIMHGICWKSNVSRLQFSLEDGLEVVVTGKITTYSPRSRYQIILQDIQYAGEGYTSAPISIAGSGASGTATSNIANGAVKYIEVNTNGATHFTTTGFAQSGFSIAMSVAL